MSDANETALESTFSSLAYSALRDKAGSLLDYLIGFQMLRVEEEGKRAVGIFGFEIDGKVYYAPAFFLNGEIRGLDLLYSADSDLFVPLSEEWVNSIINKKEIHVGDTDVRSRDERGVRIPSYIRLKTIPSSHGAINTKIASEKMQELRPYEGDDLPKMLAQSGLAVPFMKAAMADPRLREAVETFYNLDDFAITKTAAEAKKKEKPITIIKSVTDQGVDELTDAQKDQIVSGGVAAVDKRPELAKSIVYSTETRDHLTNPTSGGLYDVLWGDGSVSAAIVTSDSDNMSHVFVLRLDDGKHCVIDPAKVFVVVEYNKSEFANKLKEIGKPADEVKVGDVAVFVSDDGVSTSAYCIEEVSKGIDGAVVARPRDVYYMEARDSTYSSSPMGYGQGPRNRRWGRVDPNQRVRQIIVAPFGGTTVKFTQDRLLINSKHHKIITVNKAKFESKSPVCTYEEYTDKDCVLHCGDFGNYNTVRAQLAKIASPVETWSTDYTITIRDEYGTQSMAKKAAYEYLMVKQGMSFEDADMVIKDVKFDVQTYMVKKSADFLQFPQDGQDESFGNEMSQYHNGQIPIGLFNPRTPEDNREFYTYQSPFGGGGHEGNGVSPLAGVQEAAKSGQKEIFDASVMASLLKSHAPTDMVDRYLPTVISGMDRLGRILFLLMWHYKDFEERYGDNDLTELVDNLKSSFDDLGELIIFLKKRSMAGDPDHYGVGTGSSGIETGEGS
jgi:hypothetical protein